MRASFSTYATFNLSGFGSVKGSPERDFYVRSSYQQNEDPVGQDWQPIDDVSNDNELGDGTTALTWDLQ